jgi:hypothetical protein
MYVKTATRLSSMVKYISSICCDRCCKYLETFFVLFQTASKITLKCLTFALEFFFSNLLQGGVLLYKMICTKFINYSEDSTVNKFSIGEEVERVLVLIIKVVFKGIDRSFELRGKSRLI